MVTSREVEEALAPECERLGCDRPAAWMVGLTLYRVPGEVLATVSVGLHVCGAHGHELELGDVVNDEQWEYLLKRAFDEKELARPKRELTEIVLYRMGK